MKKILFATMLMVYLFACTHKHEDPIIYDHTEEGLEEHVDQLTLFSQSIELYIEYNQLIKDKESEFTIHLTHLDNYKPITGGQLKLILDGKEYESMESATPGIYKAIIIPENSGHSEMIFQLKQNDNTIQVNEYIEVYENESQIHDENAEEKNDHEHKEVTGEHLHEDILGSVTFTKEQAWKSNFMIEKVEPQNFSWVIQASGEMLAMPGEKQLLSALSTGIIIFETKNLVQGSYVKAGQLLFTISGQNLVDNNINLKLTEATSNYKKSENEYVRRQQLFNEKIISEKQFNETQTTYKIDSAEYFNILKNASAKGIKIYAPFTGYLHELNVSEGEYVESGQVITTISSNKVLLLRADLPQQYFNELNNIKTANFRPAYSSKVYSVDQLNGRMLSHVASVSENNHYLPIYFQVENDGSLLEGAYAEFYLLGKENSQELVLPKSAMIEEQGNYFVFIQTGGEQFLKKQVSLGRENGVLVSITEGIIPGERIVTKGALLIKAASAATSISAHDHEH